MLVLLKHQLLLLLLLLLVQLLLLVLVLLLLLIHHILLHGVLLLLLQLLLHMQKRLSCGGVAPIAGRGFDAMRRPGRWCSCDIYCKAARRRRRSRLWHECLLLLRRKSGRLWLRVHEHTGSLGRLHRHKCGTRWEPAGETKCPTWVHHHVLRKATRVATLR